MLKSWRRSGEKENPMKRIFRKFLLLFGKTQSKIQIEGHFKYRIKYKILFGNEYVIYKALPPIDFTAGSAKLPFDFSV